MSKAADSSPVTGPIQTITKGPKQQGLVALGASIVGAALKVTGFFVGIPTALDDGGSGRAAGNALALVLFFVGVVLVLLAIVLSIVSLVKGSRLLPIVALVVSFSPIALVIVLAVAARASF